MDTSNMPKLAHEAWLRFTTFMLGLGHMPEWRYREVALLWCESSVNPQWPAPILSPKSLFRRYRFIFSDDSDSQRTECHVEEAHLGESFYDELLALEEKPEERAVDFTELVATSLSAHLGPAGAGFSDERLRAAAPIVAASMVEEVGEDAVALLVTQWIDFEREHGEGSIARAQAALATSLSAELLSDMPPLSE